MNVLLLGEDRAPGSGRYLLAILRSLRATVTHVPSRERLRPSMLRRRFDAALLSDFPKAQASTGAQQVLRRQHVDGMGLMMVGGWGSFAGPFGRWAGSIVEELLPAACRRTDDRVHFPGGALLIRARPHPLWGRLLFDNPPVICGLNALRPKPTSQTLLMARAVTSWLGPDATPRVALAKTAYPLLVVGPDRGPRTAAFASDAAPHWCGGLVDWGPTRVRIAIPHDRGIEVGAQYVALWSRLILWLAGRSC